jgi:hypothetical protein
VWEAYSSRTSCDIHFPSQEETVILGNAVMRAMVMGLESEKEKRDVIAR